MMAVRDAVRWTFWPSVAMATIMLGMGSQLLSLFGEKFVAGYPVMCILAVAIVGRAAIGPAESLLNMTGGQRDCARSLMIAAGTNLMLNLFLTPRYGIIGAAVAVSTAILLGAFLNWRAARRNLGIDIGIWAVSRKLCSVGPLGIADRSKAEPDAAARTMVDDVRPAHRNSPDGRPVSGLK